ncbi:MAG: hypothetical protein HN922_07470 [Anaerolineae bacterium]|nr:hypothetical protein [Anaerolineae bacterium]
MNNLDAILEIAIGLVLVWLILSVSTLEVQDIINKMLSKRSKFLEESILTMFRGEQDFVTQFYEHPAIKVLYKKNFLGKEIKPDYIPNPVFAEVAFEMFVNLGVDTNSLEGDAVSVPKILDGVKKINDQNEELGYFVRRLIPNFDGQIDGQKTVFKLQEFEAKAAEFKINAENWFDISMTRASFWYKDQAKTFAFIIGLVLSITFNIDSIYITQELWREPTLRQTLVAQAQNANLDTGAKSVSELEEYYADLEIPVGWQSTSLPATPAAWGTKILGFLISALAAMQGAPFWFDILKNILKIKGTPKEEKAKDISPPSTPAPRMEAVG